MVTFAEEVQAIIDETARRIADLARRHLAQQVQVILAAPGTPVAGEDDEFTRTADGRTYPAACLAFDCKLAHEGPKSGFLCSGHRQSSTEEEKEAFKQEWKDRLKAHRKIYGTT